MTGRAKHGLALGCGAALAVLHAGLLPPLLDHFRRAPLQVEITPGDSLMTLSANLPEELRSRASLSIDGQVLDEQVLDGQVLDGQRVPLGADEPGMHRVEWSVRYRGGFERRVGATQLVGPFQDPADPPCALRVFVGQSFIDRGPSSGGTVAAFLRQIAAGQMAGFEQWPIGLFRSVSDLEMRWVAWRDIAGERRRAAIVEASEGRPAGILQVSLTLQFDDGEVPLWFALIPRLDGQSVRLHTHVEAQLDLENRVYQWIADLLDAEEWVSDMAGQEIDNALIDAFGLPPPLSLPGGHELRFAYCESEPIEIVTGRYAAVPMRLAPRSGPASDSTSPPGTAPVMLGTGRTNAREDAMSSEAPLAISFDINAINGVLHELWRSGFLDEQLGQAGLAERFNSDRLVRELLSVRIGEPRLTLPPTLEIGSGDPEFTLGIDTELQIEDGKSTMAARLFGTVGFAFGERAPAGLVARLTLDDLALTCHPGAGLLEPCYSNLVAAFRDRAEDVHGVLSRSFTALFETIALGRAIDLDTAKFQIERAAVHTWREAPLGILRVELFGALAQ